MTDLHSRAAEIAQFLGIPVEQAIERLSKGFGYQHQAVNDDFRRCNPQTDEELLNWYRTTDSYIWELTSYHLDPGFNYSGMCAGIAERLNAEHKGVVLCLGDGIGDLTLSLKKAGVFDPWYHDLAGSKTAEFAMHRISKVNKTRPIGDLVIYPTLTTGFDPMPIMPRGRPTFCSVVSLDYLEHVPNLPEWISAIYASLIPGGLFCAWNAFDCGSGPNGAIPCHLTVNDKYAHPASETDRRALWDVLLLDQVGFEAVGSNWYRKPK